MTTRKQIWDFMDKIEGTKIGSSYKNLEKEAKMQGYILTKKGKPINKKKKK